MLAVEDWIHIRDLARKGISVSDIARQTGRDRKTIRKVLTEKTPKAQRSTSGPRPSKLAAYRAYLQERIAEGCLNGAVLLEEITKQGYAGKISILRALLTPLRQEQIRQREATERYETGPGKQAQVDWAKFGRIWVPERALWQPLYAFLYTLGYSRMSYLEFVTSCDMEHFLDCHLNAFGAVGIAETLLYDNLKTGILGRRPDGTPIFPGHFLDFALAHGFTPTFCRPYRARTKGKVERNVGYVRQNFWVRVAAEVADKRLVLPELNERARDWTREIANVRVHGTHGEIVGVRYAAEASRLGHLDGRGRYDTSYHQPRRVGRDGRFSYRGQLYQLPLTQALRTVEVRETLAGLLTIHADDGAIVSAAVVTDRLSPARTVSPPEERAQPECPRTLRLLYPDAPLVEGRDLAVYEEVAYAARHA